MKVLAFVTVLAAVASAAPTKEGGWWPFPWPFWGLQPYGPPSNGGGPGSNLPGGGNGNLPGGGNGGNPGNGDGNLPGGGDGNLPGGDNGGNPGNGNGNLPGDGNSGNPGSGTGGDTPVSGDNGSDSGSSTLCHGILTNSSPVCCSVDVLGVASLDCSIPSSAPTDGADFGAICSATGKSAQCCTLSLANIALLCQPAIGAQ